MKKINHILSIALLSTVVVLSSCKDDEEEVNRQAVLTSKTWSIKKLEMRAAGKTVDVTSNMLPACQKDNTMKFSTDGKYQFNSGSDDCDDMEENSTGTWSFKSNETILSVVTDDQTTDMTISGMSSSTITLVEKMEIDANMDGKIGNDEVIEYITTYSGK